MTRTRRAALRLGIGALVAAVGLAIARPWTIRPIHSSLADAFDAAAYVASIWTQVLEAADRTAVDVATVERAHPQAAGGSGSPLARKALFVRGTGVVSDVDLRSRVGLARLRIDGVPAPGVAIEIGPVLRGTALRDALEFVRFTDFANQSDFAAVASTLNDHVLHEVLGPIDVEALSGQTVSFTGAAAVGNARADSALEIVPVIVQVGRGTP